MSKSKSKAAAPAAVGSQSESNMGAMLTTAEGITATMEAPAQPKGPPASFPPPRKQNGQFSQEQESRRQASIEKTKAAQKEASDRADKVLDELFDGAGIEDDEKPKHKAKEPAESAQDDAQPADESDASAETNAQPKKPDEATEPALDKALAVLRLDGWSTDDLKELSSERIVALAAKASKRQADVSEKIRDLSEKAKAAVTIPTTEPEPASQPAFDVAGAIKDAVGVLGEDTAPALEKFAKSLNDYHEKRHAAQSAEMNAMRGHVAQLVTNEARRELSGEYPELADPKRYPAVLEKTVSLFRSGDYESVRDAMHDACRLKLGDPIKERADATDFRNKRTAGQARSETNASKPPKAKTIGEIQDDVLDRLFAGDIEGAQKARRG